jgi:DNA segregation ATPase FtsK/SpoIIIE-like protein
MIFIDPKIVELKIYNHIPHLLTPVITEPPRALQALQYCVREMERRYSLLDKLSARNIKTYNKAAAEKGAETLPYLVVIIDEFADLMAVSGKELEGAIVRLAAMSRAVGIHLVLATQRPSADVITGLIKSNIPTRIAFMVASMTDSRIIIDTPGAEKLLGKGDMLYCGADSPFPVRAQGAFVSEEEAEKTAACLKSLGEPEYIDMQKTDGDKNRWPRQPGPSKTRRPCSKIPQVETLPRRTFGSILPRGGSLFRFAAPPAVRVLSCTIPVSAQGPAGKARLRRYLFRFVKMRRTWAKHPT